MVVVGEPLRVTHAKYSPALELPALQVYPFDQVIEFPLRRCELLCAADDADHAATGFTRCLIKE
jgi:hypothetical protein